MTPEQTTLATLAESWGLTVDSDSEAVAAAVVAANADTIVVHDQTRYSLASIGDRCAAILGSEAQGLLARRLFATSLQTAIEAKVLGYAELVIAQQTLAAGQLTLAGDDRQAVIDALGSEWPADILAAVKSLGVRHISPAANARLPPVTAEQLTHALTARAAAEVRKATMNWWHAKAAVINDGLHDGTLTTQQQVIDAIGGA